MSWTVRERARGGKETQSTHKADSLCLQEAETQGRHLVYHTGPGDKYKANAAVLVRHGPPRSFFTDLRSTHELHGQPHVPDTVRSLVIKYACGVDNPRIVPMSFLGSKDALAAEHLRTGLIERSGST